MRSSFRCLFIVCGGTGFTHLGIWILLGCDVLKGEYVKQPHDSADLKHKKFALVAKAIRFEGVVEGLLNCIHIIHPDSLHTLKSCRHCSRI